MWNPVNAPIDQSSMPSLVNYRPTGEPPRFRVQHMLTTAHVRWMRVVASRADVRQTSLAHIAVEETPMLLDAVDGVDACNPARTCDFAQCPSSPTAHW